MSNNQQSIVPTIKFGKYKGNRINEIPYSYLIWIYENVKKMDPSLKRWLNNNIENIKRQEADRCTYVIRGKRRRN